VTGPAPSTLPEALRRAGEDNAAVTVRFDGAARPANASVGTLMADALAIAGALQSRGIQAGDVVAVQLPNWYEGAVAQIAVALCGAVLVPIVQIYGAHELGFILRQSGACAFILPGTWRGRDFASMVDTIGELPDLRTIVVVADDAPTGWLTWAELTAIGGTYQAPWIAPDDVALLVYTSGTTADPKGVQHSHATLLAEVFSEVATGPAGGDAVHLAVFPSGHVAGLLGLLRMVVLGTPTILMDVWNPARAAHLIDEYGVTWSVGAPVHLAALLDQRDAGSVSLSTLREYMVGAASVPASLVERADAAGISAYRCYGSSEHPTVSSGRPTDPLSKRAFTDGQLVAGNEARLVDEIGNDVATGGEGELVTRGPELFVGYREPALDRAAFLPAGWFRTGDIGRFDADGYLMITDRKKDIIVRGGENISSKEIEDILATHPQVAEVAAVGAPDDRYGERVCVYVVLRDGPTLDLESVANHFQAAGVARQKTPERLVVVDELPRTAAGKVQKFVLREALRAPVS
jgi:acyl-CoA synthetase (AMP-forming)/AMP-acid ligase II